jgi:hypothetical protein
MTATLVNYIVIRQGVNFILIRLLGVPNRLGWKTTVELRERERRGGSLSQDGHWFPLVHPIRSKSKNKKKLYP